MGKAKNSSAGRFFYSFGTVFLFAVLTICIINFSRDGRIFQKSNPPASAKAAASSVSTAEGTIKIDTSGGSNTSAKSSSKKKTKPAKSTAPAGTGNPGGSAVKPSNPGEEP